jgi:hypothetical protein
MNTRIRPLFALLVASLAAAGCAEVPGGVSCLVILPVESANRSPILDVAATIITAVGRGAPSYSGGTRDGGIPLGVCSGSAEIELTHPRYQTTTVRYTSPRDRGFSGNSFTDYVTVVMIAR